jgi:AcrR family transcriptional regulator
MITWRQVARPRSDDFLPRLLRAATRVFARKGLKRARMTDIAREMGVAHGSLYNYVESKEALFLLLIERWGNLDHAAGTQLPIKTPSMTRIVEGLQGRIESVFPLPTLDGAIPRRRPSDPQEELETIVRELYVRTEESREGADILERSALDMPELCRLFFEQVRRGLFERMTRYVDARVRDGSFREVDPAVAARFIVETVTFFARHRHLDPDPLPHNDQAIRDSVIPLIAASLLVPPGQDQRRTERHRARRKARS